MLDPVHPAYWESFSFLSPLQIFSNPLFFVLRTKVNVNDFLCCVLRERTKMEGRTIDRKYSDCPIPPLMDPSNLVNLNLVKLRQGNMVKYPFLECSSFQPQQLPLTCLCFPHPINQEANTNIIFFC
ncbi:uncharacterized protein LOC128286835 [Gossypium arboreum]|uniref:uncharacterized protein LOC128286835 n=1 Tax=Gossypium arboreum TaxID=29729 RepID=UPI0022F1943D|nr:uncharacterized protein LOC128286835 [Gossypium arboreum]